LIYNLFLSVTHLQNEWFYFSKIKTKYSGWHIRKINLTEKKPIISLLAVEEKAN